MLLLRSATLTGAHPIMQPRHGGPASAPSLCVHSNLSKTNRAHIYAAIVHCAI